MPYYQWKRKSDDSAFHGPINADSKQSARQCLDNDLFFLPFSSLYTTNSGRAKTYVRLFGTRRKLVRTCKPLTWLVCGTTTFLMRKNKEIVANCHQITVELKFIFLIIKANLMLDEIRFKVFPLTSRFCGHFICFYELRWRFKSKTIYSGNNVTKTLNTRLFLSETFRTRTLGFGTTKCNIVRVRRTSG